MQMSCLFWLTAGTSNLMAFTCGIYIYCSLLGERERLACLDKLVTGGELQRLDGLTDHAGGYAQCFGANIVTDRCCHVDYA